ncbi:MAG: glutathione S-transferase family protein [Myxococcaceae bacterium]
MRLFQFHYSPFADKVRTCLALKGLSAELVEVKYLQRAELVKVSGGVGIPVLVDGTAVVSDSPRIVEYLDAKGTPWLRSDPLSLVLEQWAESVLEDTAFRLACPGLEDLIGREQGDEAKAMFRLVKERKYGAGIVATWRAEQQKWLAETKNLLTPIARVVSEHDWVLRGGKPSVADAAIAGQLHMVDCALPGLLASELPALGKWVQRLRSFRG